MHQDVRRISAELATPARGRAAVDAVEPGMTEQMPTVVVANTYLGPVDHEQALAQGRAVVRAVRLATPADVAVATADADAVLVTTQPLTADHIAAFGPRM